MTTVIVELGVGNTPSLQNMLDHVGVHAVMSGDPDTILQAERLILPGVGSFDAGMRALHDKGITDPITQAVANGTPLLGICLGMQLLGESSEEGSLPGLGLIPASFKRFDRSHGIKVPHVGWNTAAPKSNHPLFNGFSSEPRFYFTHSYHANDVPDVCTTATTTYGREFVSAYHRDNVMGVQFHPEKSHADGMTLLRNFSQVPRGT